MQASPPRISSAPLAVFALLASLAGACRTAAIYNPTISFPPRDTTVVEGAILRALANRQWLAKQKVPGVIIGTLNIRTHQAVIRIEYTSSSYSIRYEGSTDLLYKRTASGEVIHKNYNAWIEYLVKDINTLLDIPVEQS